MIMANILLLQNVTPEGFAARLKQVNLASKSGFPDFVKKADFDNKLKEVTSNKSELNELPRKFIAISTKGLIKDLKDKFSILHRAKYFSSGIFQIILYLSQHKNTLNILVGLLGLSRRNLMESLKKVLKI